MGKPLKKGFTLFCNFVRNKIYVLGCEVTGKKVQVLKIAIVNKQEEETMAFGFIKARKQGIHYDLAKFATNKLKKVNLLVKGKTELHFEHNVVSHLQASPKLRKNLITQIGQEQVEKVSQATLFGFNHRPDIAIGIDGTAIEIKVVANSRSVNNHYFFTKSNT